jgi:cell division protein FtsI (penicillin-binding protein 3)
MLQSVVHGRLGTGKNAAIDGYRVAGKTSTAQKASTLGGYDEEQYYASFVGVVPADDPKVVILVSVDAPQDKHYGNDVAAPAFARLGARIMTHLSVPRDDGTVPIPDAIALRESSSKLLDGFVPNLDVEPELPGERKVPFATGLPDFTGLSLAEALDAAEVAQVKLRAIGSGIAVMQDVPPGPVNKGASVRVLFEPVY